MEQKNVTEMIDLIVKNIDEVIASHSDLGKDLWQELVDLHPADCAEVISSISDFQLEKIFLKFLPSRQLELFQEVHEHTQEKILLFLSDSQKAFILRQTSLDDLTDLCEQLPDKELKKCLDILHKEDRNKVLSLMKFPVDSAGGIMTLDFMALEQDTTVASAITLLQRLKPNIDLHRQIYLTDKENKLVGYINLEDLVLRSPQTKLSSVVKQVAYIAQAYEDQEQIAKKMVHYHMMTVPVVNEQMFLLGVIPEETLIDVIQQEATEDVQRMSAAPVTTSYFELSFFNLLYQRSFILGSLLIIESVTCIIVNYYETTLTPFLFTFFAMLVSTGGNTSGQASAIAIQGMSSGDINETNTGRFLRREFLLGFVLAIILSSVSFARVYISHPGNIIGSVVVSISLGLIVLFSVLLGACCPLLLKKFNVDPAFSAGPLLATAMDILGIFIYCYVAYLILS